MGVGGESSYRVYCTPYTIERVYMGVGGESNYCTSYIIERLYMGGGWEI